MMISKLASAFAGYFADKDVYGREKVDIYKYGFELLLSTVINLMGILIISIIMRITMEAVFFCAAFIPLRLAAGGYHAKHHWSCILGFNLIFIGFTVLHKFISIDFTLLFLLTAVIISSILIWCLAPVEAVNKPLKPEQKEKQRTRSIVIACVNLSIVLFFCKVEVDYIYSQIFVFYISGALAASLLLVAATIANRKVAAISDE